MGKEVFRITLKSGAGKSPLSRVETDAVGAHRLLFYHNTHRLRRFDEETM